MDNSKNNLNVVKETDETFKSSVLYDAYNVLKKCWKAEPVRLGCEKTGLKITGHWDSVRSRLFCFRMNSAEMCTVCLWAMATFTASM